MSRAEIKAFLELAGQRLAGFTLRPSRLTTEYCLRCMTLRAYWFLVCCMQLDAALASLAATAHGSWAWRSRLAFTALLMPVLTNLFGLLWPLLNMPTFEHNYKRFNHGIAVITALSHAIQVACNLPWLPVAAKQHLLLHALLLTIHQDPVHEYVASVGLHLAVYELLSCMPDRNGRRNSGLLQELLDSTRLREHHVLVLLLGLLVYRIYTMGLVGPVLQAQDREQRVRHLRSIRSTTPNGKRTLLTTWRRLFHVVAGPLDPDSVASRSAIPDGMPATLSRAYVYKLVAIKAIHGVHFANFAWQRFLDHQNLLDGNTSAWKVASVAISFQVAAVLLGQAFCTLAAAAGHPAFTTRLDKVNRVAWLLCGGARIGLILLDTSLARASKATSLAGGQQLVYHSLLVLILSLFAHEEALKVFWAHLVGVTLLFCALGQYVQHQHQQIQDALGLEPGSLGPTYGALQVCTLAGVLGLLHRSMCVGRWRINVRDDDFNDASSTTTWSAKDVPSLKTMQLGLKRPECSNSPTYAPTSAFTSTATTTTNVTTAAVAAAGTNSPGAESCISVSSPQQLQQQSRQVPQTASPLGANTVPPVMEVMSQLQLKQEDKAAKKEAGQGSMLNQDLDPLQLTVLPYVKHQFDLLAGFDDDDSLVSTFQDPLGALASLDVNAHCSSKSNIMRRGLSQPLSSKHTKMPKPASVQSNLINLADLPDGFTTKVLDTAATSRVLTTSSVNASVETQSKPTAVTLEDVFEAALADDLPSAVKTTASAKHIKSVGFRNVSSHSSECADDGGDVLDSVPPIGMTSTEEKRSRSVLKIKSLASLAQARESTASSAEESEHLVRTSSKVFVGTVRSLSWLLDDNSDTDVSKPTNRTLQLLKDQLLVIIELPLCTKLALAPIIGAFGSHQMPTRHLLAFAKTLPALLYWGGTVAHAVAYFYAGDQVYQRRVALWSWRLDITLPLLHVSKTLVGTDLHFSPLRGLTLLSAKWGLLGLGSTLFLQTLPTKVMSFMLIHFWQQRSLPATLAELLGIMCLFITWPVATFALIRAGSRLFGRLQDRWKLSHAASEHADMILSYLSMAGQVTTALVITIQVLPSQAAWQADAATHAYQMVVAVANELLSGVSPFQAESGAKGSLRTAGLVVGFLVLVNICYAAMVKAQTWANPRMQWYQQQQVSVLEFREQVMMRADFCLDSIVQLLRENTADVFKDDFLVKLGVLEEHNNAVGQTIITTHVVHWGYKKVRKGLASRTLPLATLPSMAYAQEEQTILFCNDYAASNVHFEDWDMQHHAHGANCFLVLPLAMTGQSLGILFVSGQKANLLDEWMRRLITDYCVQLCHILLTLRNLEEKAAGQRLLADLMPERVAQSLMRQAMSASKLPGRFSSSVECLSPRHGPEGGGGEEATRGRAAHSPLGSHRPSLDIKRSGPSWSSHRRNSLCEPRQSHFQSKALCVREEEEVDDDDAVTEEALLDTFGNPWDDQPASPETPVYSQWHPEVTILFADIVSYTNLSQQCEPEDVMLLLHQLYSQYDALCQEHGVYKVETIGDAYMAATGLLVETDRHASNMIAFAKGMLKASKSVRNPLGGHVQIRVGIHSGRVMSGIVGTIRARYCLFGDAVNTASRMESNGQPETIQISRATYQLLDEAEKQEFKCRGFLDIKGKGSMLTYTHPAHPTRLEAKASIVPEPYSTLGLGF